MATLVYESVLSHPQHRSVEDAYLIEHVLLAERRPFLENISMISGSSTKHLTRFHLNR
jgi:hypothetical protein